MGLIDQHQLEVHYMRSESKVSVQSATAKYALGQLGVLKRLT